jgi:hypothetical protein
MSRPFRADSRFSPTQGVALGWYVMPLRGFRPTGSQSGGRSYDQGPSTSTSTSTFERSAFVDANGVTRYVQDIMLLEAVHLIIEPSLIKVSGCLQKGEPVLAPGDARPNQQVLLVFCGSRSMSISPLVSRLVAGRQVDQDTPAMAKMGSHSRRSDTLFKPQQIFRGIGT